MIQKSNRQNRGAVRIRDDDHRRSRSRANSLRSPDEPRDIEKTISGSLKQNVQAVSSHNSRAERRHLTFGRNWEVRRSAPNPQGLTRTTADEQNLPINQAAAMRHRRRADHARRLRPNTSGVAIMRTGGGNAVFIGMAAEPLAPLNSLLFFHLSETLLVLNGPYIIYSWPAHGHNLIYDL